MNRRGFLTTLLAAPLALKGAQAIRLSTTPTGAFSFDHLRETVTRHTDYGRVMTFTREEIEDNPYFEQVRRELDALKRAHYKEFDRAFAASLR